jgi:hypothetical protein
MSLEFLNNMFTNLLEEDKDMERLYSDLDMDQSNYY